MSLHFVYVLSELTLFIYIILGTPLFLFNAAVKNPFLAILCVLSGGLYKSFKRGSTLAEIRKVCTGASYISMLLGLCACFSFDFLLCGFQFLTELKISPVYNNTCTLGADGLSMVFLLLTLFVFPLLFLSAWNILKNAMEFYIAFLVMEILLILTFLTTDLFYFYVFFESLLIPMFMVIGVWGARERKIKAAYLFFMYTLFGSLIMLFGVFQLYTIVGSTDYEILHYTVLDSEQQNLIWLCFFIAFAVKMPLYPFHLWLPEAHVEAPTVGSMLLASLLLKLGGYGFLRFSLTFLPGASIQYSALVILVCVFGVVYGSLATIRQADLKRIIAYSSVAHMNLTMLGMFSNTQEGLDGAIFTVVAHGVVSAALFFCVGVLYDHYHSRLVSYYSGLATIMPILATFFLLFTLANMGFPGTSNFVGEILMFLGVFSGNSTALLLAVAGIVLGAVYSVWLFNRVFFATVNRQHMGVDTTFHADSFFVLLVLAIAMIAIGLSADIVTIFSYFYVKCNLSFTPVLAVITTSAWQEFSGLVLVLCAGAALAAVILFITSPARRLLPPTTEGTRYRAVFALTYSMYPKSETYLEDIMHCFHDFQKVHMYCFLFVLYFLYRSAYKLPRYRFRRDWSEFYPLFAKWSNIRKRHGFFSFVFMYYIGFIYCLKWGSLGYAYIWVMYYFDRPIFWNTILFLGFGRKDIGAVIGWFIVGLVLLSYLFLVCLFIFIWFFLIPWLFWMPVYWFMISVTPTHPDYPRKWW